jgi:hypothetical protein
MEEKKTKKGRNKNIQWKEGRKEAKKEGGR